LRFQKFKISRHFTFWIIPHAAGATRSVRLPTWILMITATLCLSMLISGIGLVWHLISIYNDFDNVINIKEANRRQAQEIQSLYQEVEGLSQNFEELKQRENEIKRLMGLESEEKNSDLNDANSVLTEGQGGPFVPETDINITILPELNFGSDLLTINNTQDRMAYMSEDIGASIKRYQEYQEIVEQNQEYYRCIPNQLPLNGRLTSSFGVRPSPFGVKKEVHHGIDLAAVYGTPIKAAGDGVVVFAGNKPSYGQTAVVDHANGFITTYGHNSRLLVKQGESIKKGQTIALVGSTGRSTGPHLHFAVEKNGQLIDPLLILYYPD
jgi:murein DD-endopeptidase MepM/ murein hydrolase activator NlpD